MTVTELIEALQRLHGDPDLRYVALHVVVHRRSKKPETVTDGAVLTVTVSHDTAIVTGSIEL